MFKNTSLGIEFYVDKVFFLQHFRILHFFLSCVISNKSAFIFICVLIWIVWPFPLDAQSFSFYLFFFFKAVWCGLVFYSFVLCGTLVSQITYSFIKCIKFSAIISSEFWFLFYLLSLQFFRTLVICVWPLDSVQQITEALFFFSPPVFVSMDSFYLLCPPLH